MIDRILTALLAGILAGYLVGAIQVAARGELPAPAGWWLLR